MPLTYPDYRLWRSPASRCGSEVTYAMYGANVVGGTVRFRFSVELYRIVEG